MTTALRIFLLIGFIFSLALTLMSHGLVQLAFIVITGVVLGGALYAEEL